MVLPSAPLLSGIPLSLPPLTGTGKESPFPPIEMGLHRELFLLLLAACIAAPRASAADSGARFGVVATHDQCSAGQQTRPCTYAETLTALGNATTCFCPGAGPVKRFSLTIDYLTAPSLLVGVTKVFVAANGTVPGPTIEVVEGDWVEVRRCSPSCPRASSCLIQLIAPSLHPSGHCHEPDARLDNDTLARNVAGQWTF